MRSLHFSNYKEQLNYILKKKPFEVSGNSVQYAVCESFTQAFRIFSRLVQFASRYKCFVMRTDIDEKSGLFNESIAWIDYSE